MSQTVSLGAQDFAYIRENNCFLVDKTDFIREWWENKDAVTLITRPRRFGKTLNLSMMECFFSVAYKNRNDLFEGLSIWKKEEYRKLQGIYPVIFMSFANIKGSTFQSAREGIIQSLVRLYGKYAHIRNAEFMSPQDLEFFDSVRLEMSDTTAALAVSSLSDYLSRYYGKKVLIFLDEYDTPLQEAYVNGFWKELVDFMRGLFNATFKSNPFLERGLLTGITRVSKESIFSDLNNLTVVTTTSEKYSTQFGFTQDEVSHALEEYGLEEQKEKVKYWYDGYLLEDYQVYNPKAVVSVCVRGRFRSYWSETASYEAIVPFINMNYDGLKNAIIEILSGASIKVNTAAFKNDTVNIQSKDDVLTYLIHLGYLGYNQNRRTAFVPNEEIRQELTTAVESRKWNEMITFQQESEHLLEATLDMDEEAVEEGIEKIHTEYVSNIQYNNENSLSSVLAIAYLSSMEYYFKPVRELPTGRGFADFVFIPKPEYVSSYPALVVELKWNKNAETALQQIKERKYPESIKQYTGDILLVGINYDKKTKKHQCLIESYEK